MSAPLSGRVLHLLPLDLQSEDLDLVCWLGSALAERTGLIPVLDSPRPIDRAWLDPASGQCSSNRVVDALIDHADGLQPREWTLAVTAADLFAEGRDFVFGEAAVGGAWAVLGLARLRGAGEDATLLRARLLTEAMHELGHVAGLGHCQESRCAMSRADLPEDVDRKEPRFCPGCRAALEGNT